MKNGMTQIAETKVYFLAPSKGARHARRHFLSEITPRRYVKLLNLIVKQFIVYY